MPIPGGCLFSSLLDTYQQSSCIEGPSPRRSVPMSKDSTNTRPSVSPNHATTFPPELSDTVWNGFALLMHAVSTRPVCPPVKCPTGTGVKVEIRTETVTPSSPHIFSSLYSLLQWNVLCILLCILLSDRLYCAHDYSSVLIV